MSISSSFSSVEKTCLDFFLGDLIRSFGLQSWQNQSPSGMAFSGGFRQYMWCPRSQPSHKSILSGSHLRRHSRHLVFKMDLNKCIVRIRRKSTWLSARKFKMGEQSLILDYSAIIQKVRNSVENLNRWAWPFKKFDLLKLVTLASLAFKFSTYFDQRMDESRVVKWTKSCA